MEGYRAFRECPEHGADTGMAYTERGVLRCGHGTRGNCGRELVEVRYVRADAYQGAVDALRTLVAKIERAAGHEPPVLILDALIEAEGWLARNAGGRSEGSDAPREEDAKP